VLVNHTSVQHIAAYCTRDDSRPGHHLELYEVVQMFKNASPVPEPRVGWLADPFDVECPDHKRRQSKVTCPSSGPNETARPVSYDTERRKGSRAGSVLVEKRIVTKTHHGHRFRVADSVQTTI
jgi:hypothetical protein